MRDRRFARFLGWFMSDAISGALLGSLVVLAALLTIASASGCASTSAVPDLPDCAEVTVPDLIEIPVLVAPNPVGLVECPTDPMDLYDSGLTIWQKLERLVNSRAGWKACAEAWAAKVAEHNKAISARASPD